MLKQKKYLYVLRNGDKWLGQDTRGDFVFGEFSEAEFYESVDHLQSLALGGLSDEPVHDPLSILVSLSDLHIEAVELVVAPEKSREVKVSVVKPDEDADPTDPHYIDFEIAYKWYELARHKKDQ